MFGEAEEYLPIQLGPDVRVVQPIGKSGLNVDQLLDFLRQGLAPIVDNHTSRFFVFSVFEVVFVPQVDQNVVKGLFFECQSEFPEALFFFA